MSFCVGVRVFYRLDPHLRGARSRPSRCRTIASVLCILHLLVMARCDGGVLVCGVWGDDDDDDDDVVDDDDDVLGWRV